MAVGIDHVHESVSIAGWVTHRIVGQKSLQLADCLASAQDTPSHPAGFDVRSMGVAQQIEALVRSRNPGPAFARIDIARRYGRARAGEGTSELCARGTCDGRARRARSDPASVGASDGARTHRHDGASGARGRGGTPANPDRPGAPLGHGGARSSVAARVLHPSRLKDAALMEGMTQMYGRFTPEEYEREVRALLERPDPRDVVSQIRCRTLVLSGREDRCARPSSRGRSRADRKVPSSRSSTIAPIFRRSSNRRP